ncbi:MAG: IS200/IS605 family transposase [Anaerolineales bacterium]
MKRRNAFYQLVYHFVWGTKNRLPLITPTVEVRLLPYIGFKCQEYGYKLHAVNGTSDHLHILVSLSPTILVADVAKNLKGSSSHYINKESGLGETLYWQDGYGVVTLREAEIPTVVKYIHNQKQHHQTGNLSKSLERLEE